MFHSKQHLLDEIITAEIAQKTKGPVCIIVHCTANPAVMFVSARYITFHGLVNATIIYDDMQLHIEVARVDV